VRAEQQQINTYANIQNDASSRDDDSGEAARRSAYTEKSKCMLEQAV